MLCFVASRGTELTHRDEQKRNPWVPYQVPSPPYPFPQQMEDKH